MAKTVKRLSQTLGVVLGLLIAANVVAGFMSSDEIAFDTARREVEKRQWHISPPVKIRSEITRGLIGSEAVVTFENVDEARTARVELNKPVNLLDGRSLGSVKNETGTVRSNDRNLGQPEFGLCSSLIPMRFPVHDSRITKSAVNCESALAIAAGHNRRYSQVSVLRIRQVNQNQGGRILIWER